MFKLVRYSAPFVNCNGETVTNRFVLCLDNEFHHERHVNRKVGMTEKNWKTANGATKFASNRWNHGGKSYCVVE